MIVPFSKQGPSLGGGVPAQPQVPEKYLMMALAEMDRAGRFSQAGMGPETDTQKFNGIREQIQRERLAPESRPPGPPDRPLNPGEPLPDEGQGGTARRPIRGF